MDDSTRLSSAQVAARLRIKVETLYAYVARGQLASQRAEDGSSTFDPLEVEAFAETRARGRRGGGSSSGRAVPTGSTHGTGGSARSMPGRPIMVLESSIALLDGDRLFFRGIPAERLARQLSFDEAVALLWASPAASQDDIDNRFASRREVVAAVRRATKALGPSARLVDRLTTAVLIAGSWDPVRDAIAPAAVRDAGRQMMATMVDSLPDLGRPATLSSALAQRLWPKLSEKDAAQEELALLDATLVLCMDHDLAVSTMAARVAASSRANPYAAVVAALSAFDGPLHGAASAPAVDMLTETISTGNAERAIAKQLKATGLIPGFGHLIYRETDPRARYLLAAMRRIQSFEQPMMAIDRLIAAVASRTARPANVDLALAALTVGAGMRADAGELIFAISRTAGWVAHVIDEYAQPALRLRPESRYTGVRPTA